MRNCQVRLNMNYEIYIEESSPVRVLSNVIDEIYQKALEKLEGYQQKIQQYEQYNSLFDGRNSFSKTDTDATFMHMKEDHIQTRRT